MKDVADIPTGNILTGLQGRVAGMNITTDRTPGGGTPVHCFAVLLPSTIPLPFM